MKTKLTKKLFSSISLVALLFTTLFTNFGAVEAVSTGDSVEIENLGLCDQHVQYLKDNGDTTLIVTHFVGYHENGVFHPAYCLEKDDAGVDENLSYDVSVEEALANDAVWRVVRHGYPYAGDLGLGNESDAFFVTKQAIYAVLDGRDVNRYSGADAQGDIMVEKIKELVNIGRYGTENRLSPVINISTVKEAAVDDKDETYISQVYKVDSPINSKDIIVRVNPNTAPEGTIIGDMENNQKTTFDKGDLFKVLVPRKNITKTISIEMVATGNVETYPVFYSKAPVDDYQDYALTSDPFVFTNTKAGLNYEPKGETNIIKVSSEYNQYTNLDAGSPLSNALFEIERIDGIEEYKKEFTTNELGKINQELKLGKYKITELLSPDYYVIKDKSQSYEFELKFDGDIADFTVENDNVNLKVDVEKTGTIETKAGGDIEYNFDIQNKSNTAVDNFIWGDKLPNEVRIQSITTGTFNQDNTYKVQYITNNNTNWQTIDTLSTDESKEIKLDSETLKLADGEYVEEVRFVFENEVLEGFKNDGTKINVKVNEDVIDNQIIENHTYVTASYLDTKLHDEDEHHTVVKTPKDEEKTPEKQEEQGVALPRTGE